MKCPDCGSENIEGADECAACSAPLVNVQALTPKRGMERRILEGLISDLAPKRATKVVPSDSLEKAVAAMRQAKIGCVLAVEDGKCVGVLSERELVLKIAETQDLENTSVESVMRRNPTCLKAGDEVALAFNRMAMSGHLHVPVELGNGSYGVISARDLLRYLCK